MSVAEAVADGAAMLAHDEIATVATGAIVGVAARTGGRATTKATTGCEASGVTVKIGVSKCQEPESVEVVLWRPTPFGLTLKPGEKEIVDFSKGYLLTAPGSSSIFSSERAVEDSAFSTSFAFEFTTEICAASFVFLFEAATKAAAC